MKSRAKKKHNTQRVTRVQVRKREYKVIPASVMNAYSGSISSGQSYESDMDTSIQFSETHNILTFSDEYIDNLRQFSH